MKGADVSDKSPRQAMSKKSGKSLKEKRAAKNAKEASRSVSTEDIIQRGKKR